MQSPSSVLTYLISGLVTAFHNPHMDIYYVCIHMYDMLYIYIYTLYICQYSLCGNMWTSWHHSSSHPLVALFAGAEAAAPMVGDAAQVSWCFIRWRVVRKPQKIFAGLKRPTTNNCLLLSGWWFGCHEFYFPIYWESSSQLTNIFQRGGPTTNQTVCYIFCFVSEPILSDHGSGLDF